MITLIVASIVSGIAGEISDSIVIIAIVIVNAVLGVVQEEKAEKAMEALKKMSAPNARALRSGHIETVPAKNLVPGDVVFIEAGDSIPADMRLFESANLRWRKPPLPENQYHRKKMQASLFDTEVSIGDRVNIWHTWVLLALCRGKGIVVNQV